METDKWSKSEKAVARRACQAACNREVTGIVDEVRARVAQLKEPADIWKVNDFLYRKRRDIDDKYDCRFSVMVLVLARLVREGWLKREELEGLSEEKLRQIDVILAL